MDNKNYLIIIETAIKDDNSIVGYYWETTDSIGLYTKKQAEMKIREKKKFINSLSGLTQNTMIMRRYQVYLLGENCIMETTKSFGCLLG